MTMTAFVLVRAYQSVQAGPGGGRGPGVGAVGAEAAGEARLLRGRAAGPQALGRPGLTAALEDLEQEAGEQLSGVSWWWWWWYACVYITKYWYVACSFSEKYRPSVTPACCSPACS